MASTKNINLPNLPNKKSKTFSFHFINLVRSTPHFSVFTFQFSVYRLEGCRYNAQQKVPTMSSTLRTTHCRDFLLAAVDICLIIENYSK